MSKISPVAGNLDTIVADLQKKVAALEGKTRDDNDAGGGGEDSPESPYSWAFGALLDVHASAMAKFVSVSILYLMMFIQLFLCFAFADTSDLMNDQGGYSLYATSIPMGNFYEAKMAGPTGGAPTITIITGWIAIFILVNNVRENCTSSCLRAVYPIEYLLFLAEKDVLTNPAKLLQQLVVSVLLTFAWFVRANCLPLMILYGSVKLWNSEGTATDIVKDSVVATYVLELDGTFFNFGGTVKAAYEELGGMALAPGRDGARGGTAFALGQYLVMAYDFWFTVEMWQGPMAQGLTGASQTLSGIDINVVCALRLMLIGLSNSASVFSSSSHEKGLYGMIGGGRDRRVKHILLALNFASVFVFSTLFMAIYTWIGTGFGYRLSSAATPGSTLAACMNSPTKTVQCINLASPA